MSLFAVLHYKDDNDQCGSLAVPYVSCHRRIHVSLASGASVASEREWFGFGEEARETYYALLYHSGQRDYIAFL